MTRKQLLYLAYDRSEKLNVNNCGYVKSLKVFTTRSVKEDVGDNGDITTSSVLSRNFTREAQILCKQEGIVAGVEEAAWFYSQYKIVAKPLVKDGDLVGSGDALLVLKGKEFDLLKTERTGLNLLQRMSGIASATNELVKKCQPMLVAATRKTHWGNLDNKAVSVGGGGTHRLGLWESILIKENHLKSLSHEGSFDVITEALKRAWKNRNKAVFIEIEVEAIDDAVRAAQVFASLSKKDDKQMPCIVMLDNFSANKCKQTIELFKEKNLYKHVLVEASGGITPKNVLKFRDAGVDVVSLGYLTHSAPALDIGQYIVR